MAISKNHITYNQSCKWHRNGIQNHWSQSPESLKVADPKSLRYMNFAKKHKKGMKKMQAYNRKGSECMHRGLQCPCGAEGLMPKIPKGPSIRLSCLAFIAQLKLEKWI
ncbi:60S ribosomal protein L29-like [Apodemus sylvaticus]|uniref:60S ribosomal protein L29-like n=1 Tax=Apodemus sylvaticus TaxID=10129 RepID=UPI00224403D7|nr:60S ribosomal protein L29-like [Apodemus sylvaticus]